MGEGSLDKPSGGEALIAKTLKEIQEANAKTNRSHLIITIVGTFLSAIGGVIIGKYFLP